MRPTRKGAAAQKAAPELSQFSEPAPLDWARIHPKVEGRLRELLDRRGHRFPDTAFAGLSARNRVCVFACLGSVVAVIQARGWGKGRCREALGGGFDAEGLPVSPDARTLERGKRTLLLLVVGGLRHRGELP